MAQRIVIINQPIGNRGDQAAFCAFVKMLKSRNYDVMCVFWGENDKISRFVDDLVSVEWVCFSSSSRVERIFYPVFQKIEKFSKIRQWLPETYLAFSKIMRSADAVICAPGGVCMGAYKSWAHLFYLEMALRLNRKVAIWGRSIGPFSLNGISNRIFSRWSYSILRRVGYLSLRDQFSCDIAKNLGVPYTPTIDSAFAVNPEVGLSDELKRNTEEEYFVVVPNQLYSWHPLFRMADPEKLDRFYIDIIRGVVARGYNVLLMPQLFDVGGNGDYTYFNHLCKHLDGCGQNVFVVPEIYGSDSQQMIVRGAKFVIGARYHSIIFSINNAVPFLCLSYEHKMLETLKILGLESHSIQLGPDLSIASGDVLMQLDSLERDSESVRACIEKRREQARSIVEKAFSDLSGYIESQNKAQ